MERKVINLEIIDDLENSGVDAIALVDEPAIGKYWMYMRSEDFVKPIAGESESDFMSRCMPVVLGEGKPEDQAAAICYSMYEQGFSIDTGSLPPYTHQVDDEDKLVKKENFNEEMDIFGYRTKYFYICPGAIGTFKQLIEDSKGEDDYGMVRAAARAADGIFAIEKNAIENDFSSTEDLKEAMVLLEDFNDIMGEIAKRTGKTYDTSYMSGHIEKIHEYLNKGLVEASEDFDLDEACWPGYEAIGTKILNGRRVPNCVPVQNSKQFKHLFADEDEKIVVGPVAIPNLEIIRKGEDGNPYYVKFSEGTIARMAEKFMRELRAKETNIQHIDDMDAGSYVFESWVVEDAETDKANTIYNMEVPKGTWMTKMRVTNPNTWKKVKAGELRGLSLQGNFVEEEDYQEYLKDKKKVEKLIEILNGE